MYLTAHLDNLRTDPKQARREFSGIEELAQDILQYGLLQNLVVRPGVQEASDVFYYTITAGERRFRALQILKSKDTLPKGWTEWKVPLLVIENSDAAWVNICENLHRQDLAPWELGRRFLELLDAGFTREQIAVKINKSSQYLYPYTRISLGLHPNIIERIRRVGKDAFPLQILSETAKLIDEFGQPLEKEQHALLDKHLKLSPTGVRRTRAKTNLQYRVNALTNLQVPPEYQKVVEQIQLYLLGKIPKVSFE